VSKSKQVQKRWKVPLPAYQSSYWPIRNDVLGNSYSGFDGSRVTLFSCSKNLETKREMFPDK